MRSGTICAGGGACDLSRRLGSNDVARGAAISCVAISTVVWPSANCSAHAMMDAAGDGSSWHPCPALNAAVCAGPGASWQFVSVAVA